MQWMHPSIDTPIAATPNLAAGCLPPTLDAHGCAQLLFCSKARVEEAAERGELPATKFGRSWIFVTAQLLAYVAERCTREAAQRQGKKLVKRQDAPRPDRILPAVPAVPAAPAGPRRGPGRPPKQIPTL